ncbi:MAG: hypothetical protein R2788_09715 [Saprospiraceae bacterium]
MNGLKKSQQFRWMKGGGNSRKMLPTNLEITFEFCAKVPSIHAATGQFYIRLRIYYAL